MDVKERIVSGKCEISKICCIGDGGPGWTRTSDPTLIKRVL